MKIAVISDIHGNIYALMKALEDIDEQNVDKIICLGDLVGYGPHPNESIALIRRREIPCIKGNYDASVVDEIIPVPDDEAIRGGRELASTEGLLAGISSGAAVYAARLLAERPEFADKMIVALLPDTGERYLSTELFAFDTYPLE